MIFTSFLNLTRLRIDEKIFYMMRVITTFAAMILAAIPVCAFSYDKTLLSQLLTPYEQKAVLEGNILTMAYLKDHKIFSNYPESLSIKAQALPDNTTGDYSDYELLGVEKAFIPFTLNTENLLALFNNLTAYSQLSGMRYYSRTDKRLQPYILSSFRIDSPDNDEPVNDEKYDTLPSDYSAYVLIEDNRFGKLLIRNNISVQNNNIAIRNKTLEPMSKLFIPINKSGDYEQQMWLMYDDDAKGFFYYSMHAMRIRSGLFLKLSQLTPGNMANRIRALTVHLAARMGHDWKDRIIASP